MSTDTVTPGAKWEFNAEVAACFDDMLARSIPEYALMREAVTALAKRFAQRGTWIVDLGCSRGGALKPILDALGAANQYLGIEISEPMLEAARADLKGWITSGVVKIASMDLRREMPKVPASVVLSVLTLQFTPIEYRQNIVQHVFEELRPGGAFLLVEKVLGEGALLDATFVESYYELKCEHGYDAEAVARKRLSLEGVLVPVTAEWNVHLLKSAGFRVVDCFWRWMNFAGFVAIKV